MRQLSACAVVLAFLGVIAPPALAQDVERDAREIEAVLVAPCCWTQQVSVHQSEAATKIKQEIRASLRRGLTRQQILDGYVAEYGPAILIQPPARGFGASLYVLPVVALLASAFVVGFVIRRFTRGVPPPEPAGQAIAVNGDLSERLDDELRDLD